MNFISDSWKRFKDFNFAIFPAPRFNHNHQLKPQYYEPDNGEDPIIKAQVQQFQNTDNQKVPFLQVSSENSRKKDEVIIYFHGNGEDIFQSKGFVIPIFKQTQTTILCLQYPTYSCYKTQNTQSLSDRIKKNSLLFHKHVRSEYKTSQSNIYIVGRSIGTGPATYLASRVKCEKLALISPFDSIKKVAVGWVPIVGNIVTNHFQNQKQIETYKGELLVVHGKKDEVINIRHGEALVNAFNSKHQKKATFNKPAQMSHNNYDMYQDIVKPIQKFLGRPKDQKNPFL